MEPEVFYLFFPELFIPKKYPVFDRCAYKFLSVHLTRFLIMSTHTQTLYQIVFSTKFRDKTLTADRRDHLFRYISGILRNKKCQLHQLGGVEDHIHILMHLHPVVPLASLVKDIKLATGVYIKSRKLFRGFSGWQDGYGAFTYSIKEKARLIGEVRNQVEYHRTKTFKEEFLELLEEHEIEFDEKYLW